MIGRSAALALIVGTILVAINSGDALLSRGPSWALLVRVALTYAVPFLVSLYTWRSAARVMCPGQVAARRETVVCLTCDDPASCAVIVESGETIPPCQRCGADTRWVARGR